MFLRQCFSTGLRWYMSVFENSKGLKISSKSTKAFELYPYSSIKVFHKQNEVENHCSKAYQSASQCAHYSNGASSYLTSLPKVKWSFSFFHSLSIFRNHLAHSLSLLRIISLSFILYSSLTLFHIICLYLSLLHYLFLFLSLSLTYCLFFTLSVSHYISFSVLFSLNMYLLLNLFLFHSLSLSLTPRYLTLSLSLPLPLSYIHIFSFSHFLFHIISLFLCLILF